MGDPEVEYTVLTKSRELQRQGLLAFKLQDYEEAESCYSLAMKPLQNREIFWWSMFFVLCWLPF